MSRPRIAAAVLTAALAASFFFLPPTLRLPWLLVVLVVFRALVRATDGGPLSVMFPMVTIAEEFFEAKALLLDEIEWSRQRGYPEPCEVRVGAMLEARRGSAGAFAWSPDGAKRNRITSDWTENRATWP